MEEKPNLFLFAKQPQKFELALNSFLKPLVIMGGGLKGPQLITRCLVSVPLVFTNSELLHERRHNPLGHRAAPRVVALPVGPKSGIHGHGGWQIGILVRLCRQQVLMPLFRKALAEARHHERVRIVLQLIATQR